MDKLKSIYRAVVRRPKNQLISVDEVAKETKLDYFIVESILRAMAKEKIISLASICDSSEQPIIGVFNGSAKNKEYYFCSVGRIRRFEKENGILFSEGELSISIS